MSHQPLFVEHKFMRKPFQLNTKKLLGRSAVGTKLMHLSSEVAGDAPSPAGNISWDFSLCSHVDVKISKTLHTAVEFGFWRTNLIEETF